MTHIGGSVSKVTKVLCSIEPPSDSSWQAGGRADELIWMDRSHVVRMRGACAVILEVITNRLQCGLSWPKTKETICLSFTAFTFKLFGFLSNSSTLLVRVSPGQPGVALRQRLASGRGATAVTAPAVHRRRCLLRSPSHLTWAGHSLRGSIIMV
jgi:hypothetical protein